jgi:adenosine deaminase
MSKTAFIDRLPKAELHLHIEGTLEPAMMLNFARRNGVALPYKSVEEIKAAYRFGNLQDFLDLYYLGAGVLRTEQDFYELARAYLKRARRDNVLHAEVFFDAQAHTARGVPFKTVIDGLRWAVWDARTDLGIDARLILCFLRHLSPDDAMATLEQALPYRGDVVAVGLDSSEAGNPPSKFKHVFDRARAEGFLTVAHAGEEGPAGYVRQALDDLRVRRVDHGNHAIDDDALMWRLAEEHTPLTMCPLSNLKLGVISAMKEHPLKRMLRRGLMVTVNSDDPAYFRGYVNDNYRAVADALDLGEDDLYRLARNSFEASFLPEREKRAMIRALDAAVGQAAA